MLKFFLQKPLECLARIFFTIIGLFALFLSLFFSFIWDAPYTIFYFKLCYNKYLNEENSKLRMLVIDLLFNESYKDEYRGYLHEKRKTT